MKTYKLFPEKLRRVFAFAYLLAVSGVSAICSAFCLAPGFLQGRCKVLESAC